MGLNNTNNNMNYKIFNILPVGGGSLGAISPIYIDTITWHGIGGLALQAAVLAFIGGVIGWGVKRGLDKIFKKNK